MAGCSYTAYIRMHELQCFMLITLDPPSQPHVNFCMSSNHHQPVLKLLSFVSLIQLPCVCAEYACVRVCCHFFFCINCVVMKQAKDTFML